MIKYQRQKPVIFIHLPKTGGTAVREVVRGWYRPSSFFFHYYDEKEANPPRTIDLEKEVAERRRSIKSLVLPARREICIYGHFSRKKGYGIENQYPSVRQFVTILRDPFEVALSGYFYLKRVGSSWHSSRFERLPELEEVISTRRSQILEHFPEVVTARNYRRIIQESFIAIGTTERLPLTMKFIANKLGKTFSGESLQRLNTTPRPKIKDKEKLRDIHRRLNPLVYEVYDYVSDGFSEWMKDA